MKQLEEIVSNYTDKKVTITGGSGYVGSVLSKFLFEGCNSLTITSRNKPINSRFNFAELDLLELKSWKKIINESDVIFHLAGNTSLYEVEKNPMRSLRETLRPLQLLAESLSQSDKPLKFVYASTATVYGNTYKRKVNENDKPMPSSFYDLHKTYAEEYLYFLNRAFNLDFISLRLANIYGPSPSESSSEDRGIINKVARKLLEKEEITIFGDGEYYRDYIYIDDVVKAFLLSGIQDSGSKKVFNICSGQSITLKEAFSRIQNLIDPRSEINFNYSEWPRNSHIIEKRNFHGDNELFSSTFNWQAEKNFSTGVKLLLESFKK